MHGLIVISTLINFNENKVKAMKYLKMLVITIITVFTFGSAMAQVQVRANIGTRDHHHYRHHHRWHRHDDHR